MDKFSFRFDEDPQRKTAYLTFDDGPSAFTPDLLKLLKENSVKATFFISFQGEDTAEKRKILKQEASEGNSVGVHSWSHDYFSIYNSEESFLNDFNKMRTVIREVTGIDPKINRFPGGVGNTVSFIASCGQIIMPRLVRDVEAMGIKPFDWNAGGQDAELPYPSAPQLVRDILSDTGGKKDLVILLHDTHQFTIDAVPELINSLRAKGYSFKTLDSHSPSALQPFANKKDVILNLRKSLKLIGELANLLESSK